MASFPVSIHWNVYMGMSPVRWRFVKCLYCVWFLQQPTLSELQGIIGGAGCQQWGKVSCVSEKIIADFKLPFCFSRVREIVAAFKKRNALMTTCFRHEQHTEQSWLHTHTYHNIKATLYTAHHPSLASHFYFSVVITLILCIMLTSLTRVKILIIVLIF